MSNKKTNLIKTVLDRAKETLPIKQSLLVGGLLGIVGGFLDSYTFVLRGGVFANAQTGNMVLLAINAVGKDFVKVIYYFIPILAFFLGVLITEVIKKYYDKSKRIRHEYVVLIFEAVLLFVVGFIPTTVSHLTSNVIISFICSMQVNSFRSIDGSPYATTMCTGNLRSAGEKFFLFLSKKDKSAGKTCGKYFMVIVFFCIGAGIGVYFSEKYGVRSVWICSAILLLTAVILIDEQRKTKNLIQ